MIQTIARYAEENLWIVHADVTPEITFNRLTKVAATLCDGEVRIWHKQHESMDPSHRVSAVQAGELREKLCDVR